MSATAVDTRRQRTATLLLCARVIKYEQRQACSFINEINVGHPRQANTREAKPLLCRRAAFSLPSNVALNARSPTVSAARRRPPAVDNHRPPLSLCHRELSSSLPASPPQSPNPPIAAHFEDEKTQDISSQGECFEFHVLRRPAALNNGALFCGPFFPPQDLITS